MKTFIAHLLKSQASATFILFAAILFSSCSGNGNSQPGSEYSENGIALSQMTIKVYMDFNKTMYNKEYQEEFIKILNDLSPDTYIMNSESDYSNELENLYKINAFRNLERVFLAYNLQLDPNVSTKASNLQENINSACHSLDSLDLRENIKLKNEQIKKNVNSSKFRIEETIFQLTNLYAELWAQESQKWFLVLENYQETTNKGIKRIPINVFNTEKLRTIIDEPYNNGAILANLYKLKMIKENQINIIDLENKIQTVSEAFSLLIAIQGELMKKKKSKLKVQELNTRLGTLLSN